ncbi:MAG: hypothetical protein RE468_04755 [Acidithiobacillus caldus]|uniref:hypothetical protein n=1 Tax=Acidithiobacillus caldus TaxID=33059 RepID=UPI0028154003|nr:hypothetical protein [Acidithiobacillus caldus]WMT47922.1 MAG: hypothetical protein RE468_04755 [Acidithiobacillus caldus]
MMQMHGSTLAFHTRGIHNRFFVGESSHFSWNYANALAIYHLSAVCQPNGVYGWNNGARHGHNRESEQTKSQTPNRLSQHVSSSIETTLHQNRSTHSGHNSRPQRDGDNAIAKRHQTLHNFRLPRIGTTNPETISPRFADIPYRTLDAFPLPTIAANHDDRRRHPFFLNNF